MTSIITGDIIQSKKVAAEKWLGDLKKELNLIGSSPRTWQIYRGDSFQAEIKDPLDALAKAIKIKSSIKSSKGIDVRIAIGIGDKTYDSANITESNGTAFVFSGRKFEQLQKEKRTLAVASGWEDFDRDINLIIRLASIIMDKWKVNSAEIVNTCFEHPEKSQEELGEMFGIRQNAVSSRLRRARFEEIIAVIEIYKLKLKQLL